MKALSLLVFALFWISIEYLQKIRSKLLWMAYELNSNKYLQCLKSKYSQSHGTRVIVFYCVLYAVTGSAESAKKHKQKSNNQKQQHKMKMKKAKNETRPDEQCTSFAAIQVFFCLFPPFCSCLQFGFGAHLLYTQ